MVLTQLIGQWPDSGVIGMLARDQLWDLALDQYGYITLGQAEAAGVSASAIRMMAGRGTLEHAARGVYRFPRLPASSRDPYMLAVLWAGRRAHLSHETALAVRDLSDLNPGRVDVTVPRATRLRRRGGELYAVHRQDLHDDQTTWWEGIPIVTAATSIRQCMDAGVPTYLLRQAINQSDDRGEIGGRQRDQLLAELEAGPRRAAQQSSTDPDSVGIHG